MDRRSFIMDAAALLAGAWHGGGSEPLMRTPMAGEAGAAATVLVDTSLEPGSLTLAEHDLGSRSALGAKRRLRTILAHAYAANDPRRIKLTLPAGASTSAGICPSRRTATSWRVQFVIIEQKK